jgi:hypothetical protein
MYLIEIREVKRIPKKTKDMCFKVDAGVLFQISLSDGSSISITPQEKPVLIRRR